MNMKILSVLVPPQAYTYVYACRPASGHQKRLRPSLRPGYLKYSISFYLFASQVAGQDGVGGVTTASAEFMVGVTGR